MRFGAEARESGGMVGLSGFHTPKESLIRVNKVTKEFACGPSVVRAVRSACLTL